MRECWTNDHIFRLFSQPACALQVLRLYHTPGRSTRTLLPSSMLRMSSDSSLSDMLAVHLPALRWVNRPVVVVSHNVGLFQARNAYGVTTGSYQYVDANGLLQTVNYIADPVNGFRVAGTNLPVGPAVPAVAEVEPLVAPTFNPEPLVAPGKRTEEYKWSCRT